MDQRVMPRLWIASLFVLFLPIIALHADEPPVADTASAVPLGSPVSEVPLRNPVSEVPLGNPVSQEPLGTPVAEEPLGTPVTALAMTATDLALRALAPEVKRMSHPNALRIAFDAYYRYRAANPELVRKPYLYYVDLGLSNSTARGYVFNMESMTLVEGPFNVAHGRGSSAERNAVPTRFSNRAGSKASSLGLYLAQETYTFGGKSGGRYYSSVGLRMRGESDEFNGAARERGIVAHGAPYVTSREAGRSEGCPAMELHRANRLLPLIANGGVVFIFSPNHPRWLREDPWVRTS